MNAGSECQAGETQREITALDIYRKLLLWYHPLRRLSVVVSIDTHIYDLYSQNLNLVIAVELWYISFQDGVAVLPKEATAYCPSQGQPLFLSLCQIIEKKQ